MTEPTLRIDSLLQCTTDAAIPKLENEQEVRGVNSSNKIAFSK